MVIWNALLLIYENIDVNLRSSWWRKKHFRNSFNADEVNIAIETFGKFPALAQACSKGEVSVNPTILKIDRPLNSMTEMGEGLYWPSPTDTEPELTPLINNGKYDSVFIYWAQNNFVTGETIPSGGWGLGMAPSEWSKGATYATVANAPREAWERPEIGEVWLHEWLHGVCGYFQQQGFAMPDGDADGGGRHGYIQHKLTGWTDFYCDLMTGKVISNGKPTGITSEAWRLGAINSAQA